MKDIRETCAFSQLTDILLTKAKTEIGRKKISELTLFHDEYFLNHALALLDEAQSFYAAYGLLPFINSEDLTPIMDFAHKGGILTPKDFMMIVNDIENVNKTCDFIKNVAGDYPLMKEMIRDFQDLVHLLKTIQRIIAPSLQIYDDASSELRSLRKQIIKAEGDLKMQINAMASQYQNLLTDKTITMRNGHYVLPVKMSEKGQVSGIVHDVSSSGMTVFIEPSAIVEQNNRLLFLHQQEEDEIKRILAQLTGIVLNDERALISNNNLLGELDFVQAKAIYAHENDCYVSKISSTPRIQIKGGRHPFIDRKKIVKNDFLLDDEHRVMILSGPNAGGKTVAMKCVGLLCYMHQCGLAIPCDEPASISMFDHFLCDIGDQQSLNDDLSTFSGHMEAIKTILASLNERTLVLIDEIGTGTDPQEGEALAIALIEEFLNKRVFAMVSSHFPGVKEYAFSNDHLILGSMLFDEEKLQPLYRLKLGVPGRSYALEVAKRHGIPSSIIDRALALLSDRENHDLTAKLDYLEKLIAEEENKRQQLADKEASIKQDEEKIARFYEEMATYRQRLESEFQEEKNQKMRELEAMIDDAIDRLKEKDLKYHEAVAMRKRIHDSEDLEEENIIDEKQDLAIDDYVVISDSGITGRITRLRNQQVTILTSEGLTIQTKLNRCQKIKKPLIKGTKPRQNGDPIVATSIKMEHNVIGLHVEEALESVEKYLDNARVHHLKMVRIIHGSGTGALRTAIHQYLKKQDFVESYRLGGANEGGVGATVVTLK